MHQWVFQLSCMLFLISCGGGISVVPTYTVGGTLGGLASGGEVTLLNNGGDALTLTNNGSFTFATPIAYNNNYAITVGKNPPGQTCSVTNGSGAGVIANINNVSVTCSTLTYAVGGTVSGLLSGQQVTLSNNDGDALTLTNNGSFTFKTPVAYGGNYIVRVAQNPIGQICSVTDGSGTGIGGNVSNVSVTCSTLTYTVGGTVSGLLSGQQVTLLNNNSDALTVTSNGSFTFKTPVTNGSNYAVKVGTRPATQVCTVANGAGNIAAADVLNINISCLYGSAYVTNVNDGTIGQYTIGSDGALTPMSTLTVSAGNGPFNAAIDATGQRLYAVNINSDTVSQYTIGSNGALTPISNSPIALTGRGPRSIAIDPTGRYAYVVNAPDNNASQYNIGSNGALIPMSNPTIKTTPTVSTTAYPSAIAIDPTGHYAYVANYSNNVISQHNISSNGELTPINTPEVYASVSPVSIAIDPTGHYAYAVASYSNTVSQFTIGDTGGLTPMVPKNISAGKTPGGIAIDPTGRHVYVVNSSDNTVSQYNIGSNGTLTLMSVPTVATGKTPVSIAIDRTGRYAYVTNSSDNTISQYNIGSDGALMLMSVSTVATGKSPRSIVLLP